jgi:ribosomal protein S18 acetylase RimI-like enzyme
VPKKNHACDIVHADSSEHVAVIRLLFHEYADWLGFDLSFQGFDEELAHLPGRYARPDGRLLLAQVGGDLAGCVAIQPLAPGVCEMKRLYVRSAFRGMGVGRVLAENAIHEAKVANYRAMRLDTIEPLMSSAIAMYRSLGFREIEPYRPNPIPGARYMELRWAE